MFRLALSSNIYFLPFETPIVIDVYFLIRVVAKIACGKLGDVWAEFSDLFNGLLINMQYVKRVSGKIVFVSKFLVYRGK